MVARPERDADERQVALDRDLRDGAERPVAAGDAEGGRIGGARELGGVVVAREHVRGDAAPLGRGDQVVELPLRRPGARIHEQEALHDWFVSRFTARTRGTNGT